MREYQYATGDLMGLPQTYFYTRFEGPEFLRSWWTSRQAALDSLPAPSENAPPFNSRAEGTARLLELAFVEASSADKKRVPLAFHAETVLTKFEVGKRIYDLYDANLKPADREKYRTHEYYVRAGESFQAAFARTGDLRGLNALLKCLDTLTAHRTELASGLGARVARLIVKERQYVERIAADRRIEIQ
jgi:hypothetical protein